MSGICAVWHKHDPESARDTLARMTAALSLDKADRPSYVSRKPAGAGVSARFETQQMHGTDNVLVACDADLVNEDELRVLVGRTFEGADNAATAALLAGLYERFGAGLAEKLRGSFSFVLWDARKRKLIAAVDGFAINRLVYYEDQNVLLVASRIDALTASGYVDTNINPRAVANILNFTANVAPETIFANVQRLVPGGLLIASSGQTRVTRYWDMRYGAGTDSNEQRLSEEMFSVVERSVASHCKNEDFSRLGAYLSGGTDSSTVVGMMSRMKRGRPHAFSIGFKEERFNELEYANIAAARFGADHHVHLVGPEDCFDALPAMVRYFDEPLGNSSAIPTYFCGRLAAQTGVKVLLSGDGGDELFGGNERYAVDKMFQMYQDVPRVVRKGLIEPALAMLPFDGGISGKARRYVKRSNIPSPDRYFSYDFLRVFSPADVFDYDFLRTLGGYSVLDVPTEYYTQAPARDHLDRLLYIDVKMTLGDNDLPKVTCMSELAGIRTRFPFLDRAVAEFSGRVPARLKVKGFEKRYLFKRAFRDLLPAEIIRKTKHGFGIPVGMWLKSDRRMREMSNDVLRSPRAFERGYFRRAFMEDLFRKHETDDATYYGDTLWTFLVLELWHRQAVDRRVEAAV